VSRGPFVASRHPLRLLRRGRFERIVKNYSARSLGTLRLVMRTALLIRNEVLRRLAQVLGRVASGVALPLRHVSSLSAAISPPWSPCP
jgi:hypothetical protein